MSSQQIWPPLFNCWSCYKVLTWIMECALQSQSKIKMHTSRMPQGILEPSCSTEYAAYKTGQRPEGSMNRWAMISPLINCIFDTLAERNKAEILAGTVALDLFPGTLQILGNKLPETASIALRHPVLALLLALGSPLATVARTDNFKDHVKEAVEGRDMEGIIDWLFTRNSRIQRIRPMCLSVL